MCFCFVFVLWSIIEGVKKRSRKCLLDSQNIDDGLKWHQHTRFSDVMRGSEPHTGASMEAEPDDDVKIKKIPSPQVELIDVQQFVHLEHHVNHVRQYALSMCV